LCRVFQPDARCSVLYDAGHTRMYSDHYVTATIRFGICS
jgi:hypothetical protein